jgi:hypothetical protein
VRIDEHGQHAQRFVLLDEAHAAHVRGKIVDFVGALSGAIAVFFEIQIEGEIFDVVEALIPFGEGLSVNRSNMFVSLSAKLRDEMTAYESTRTGDYG